MSALVALVLSISGGAVGQVTWTGANLENDNWSQGADGNAASNWSTPAPPSEDDAVLIGSPAPTLLDVSARVNVLNVVVDGELNVLGGRTLAIGGGSVENAGTIVLNFDASDSTASLEFDQDSSLGGSGIVVLGRTGQAAVEVAAAASLAHAAGHTLRGEGMISGDLVNNGTIVAEDRDGDGMGRLVLRNGEQMNHGLIEAAPTGTVEIAVIRLSQGTEGRVVGRDGTVLIGGNVRVVGGALATDGGGRIVASQGAIFENVTNEGALHLPGGRTATVDGESLTNHGIISVNSDGLASNTILQFNGSIQAGGNGGIALHFQDAAEISTTPGSTVTQLEGHVIHGEGTLSASLINNGHIIAERMQSTGIGQLTLRGADKTNNHVIRIEGDAVLDIRQTTIHQDPLGGVIDAGDGRVLLDDAARIVGGRLESNGTGRVQISGDATLENVTNNAPLNIGDGALVRIAGQFINNGPIRLHDPGGPVARVEAVNDVVWGGTGAVTLIRSDRGFIQSAPGATITHAAEHTIQGVGNVTAALVNNGVVEANESLGRQGVTLALSGPPKTNNHIFRAAANSVLSISNTTVTQDDATGRIVALDRGTVQVDGATIVGGRLESEGTGEINFRNSSILDDVTNSGTIGSGVLLRGTFTNNGTVNGGIALDGDVTITGTGQIVANRGGVTATDATLINSAGHTIRGDIRFDSRLVNDGVIEGSITLTRDPKINNNVLRATSDAFINIAGTVSVTQNGGRIIAEDQGTVLLRGNAEIIGGRLETVGGGLFRVDGPWDVGLEDVTIAGTFHTWAQSTTRVRGSFLTNEGTITVNSNGGNADARIVFTDSVRLGGTGSIVLNHATRSHLDTALGVTVTQAADHTISGKGRINSTIINDGRLEGLSPNDPLQIHGTVMGTGILSNIHVHGTHAPGVGPAVVNVEGLYSFSDSGQLQIELNGLEPGSGHDQVNASGTVDLDGEVIVSFLNDGNGYFQPASGTQFAILTSTAPIGGEFAQAVSDGRGLGAEFRLIHEPFRVILEVAQTYLIGDYSGNGLVEQADLDLALANWGQSAEPAPDGWTNDLPTGIIDQDELDRILTNWGNALRAPEAANLHGAAAVPEPSGCRLLWVLVVMQCAWICRGRVS